PLTIGHHVDHQLTRQALNQTTLTPWFYEDFPYTTQPTAIDPILRAHPQWQLHQIPMTTTAINQRIAAINAYQSQIKTLFATSAAMATAVHHQIQRYGGQRLWQPLPPTSEVS
ncbi:MAG TPA: hypothetical protein VLL52_02560, partial [Anaerolineae bacterium]|nr:hypothetical protein [Anaerolineae bacterium]